MTLQDMTHLEKESRYRDPDEQLLGQERHTQQEEQPWQEHLLISWIEYPKDPKLSTSSCPS
jgi:hypothetical protein